MPRCPIHDRELLRFPDDDIRQWECPICQWSATDDFIQSMTKEKIKQIRKEHQDTMNFRIDESARREAEKIQVTMEIIKKKENEKQSNLNLSDYF